MRFWDTDDGTPPDLVPLVGQRLLWMGILPKTPTLCMRFARHFVMVEPMTTVGQAILRVEVGDIKPGADFSDLDGSPDVQVTAHCVALVGKRLNGMFGSIFAFDKQFGVRVSREGINFVRKEDPHVTV